MFELDIVYIQPVSNHTHSVPLRFRLLYFWIQGLPYFFDFLGKLFCDSSLCTSEFSGIHSDVFPVLKIVEFHYDCSRLTVAITLHSDSVRSVYFNLLFSDYLLRDFHIRLYHFQDPLRNNFYDDCVPLVSVPKLQTVPNFQ